MTDKSATPLTFEQAEYKARLDGDRAAIQVIDELKRELAACREELEKANRRQHQSDLNYDALERLLKQAESRLASHAEREGVKWDRSKGGYDIRGCWQCGAPVGEPLHYVGCSRLQEVGPVKDDYLLPSPAGPDALAEEFDRYAKSSQSYSDNHTDPVEKAWGQGRASAYRRCAESARSRPEDRGNAEIGKRVRQLVDGGPFDLRDSPRSFTATCERLVAEADAAMSQQEKKDG